MAVDLVLVHVVVHVQFDVHVHFVQPCMGMGCLMGTWLDEWMTSEGKAPHFDDAMNTLVGEGHVVPGKDDVMQCPHLQYVHASMAL